MKFKNAWYIFLYHNVDWHSSPFLHAMKGSISPDFFEEHLKQFKRMGDLVSVQEGYERFKKGNLNAPLISFWFDDFYSGVRHYAAPIMAAHGITGAISVNRAFCERTQFFWRLQLCYLHYAGKLDGLLKLFRDQGVQLRGGSVKEDTMQLFSSEMLTLLEEYFWESIPESASSWPFDIFDDAQGLKEMHTSGWEISNHSSHHYPIAEPVAFSLIGDEFKTTDHFLSSVIGHESRFWVLPFDRIQHNSPNLEDWMNDISHKTIVRVGDKVNDHPQSKVLYRISTPVSGMNDLKRHLHQAGCLR